MTCINADFKLFLRLHVFYRLSNRTQVIYTFRVDYFYSNKYKGKVEKNLIPKSNFSLFSVKRLYKNK